MNPDVAKLKKRKFSAGDAEELSLPAAKHKCCEAVVDSGEGSLFTVALDEENGSCVMDVLHAQVDSVEDSNTFPGDSQFSPEVKFDAGSRKIDSYDEASTSWSNSASYKSHDGSFYSESGILTGTENGKMDMELTGGEKYPHLDVVWDDTDFLDEYISTEDCSGMNPNLYALSSESWSLDQEAQLGRRKPTIDQEFEQYFSTLML